MQLFRARPPFVRDVQSAPERVVSAIRDRLIEGSTGCEGAVASRHMVLRVPPGERHFFSPVLDARVQDSDGGARIVGSFGPHPNVWTMFIFVRACLLVALTSTTVFACSQTLVSGASLWWRWAGVAAVLVVLEYVGAQVGQRLGHEQIASLERLVDGALAELEAGSSTDGAASRG